MKDAFFITTLLFMAIGMVLLQECDFLIPYRRLLYERYLSVILQFAALLYFNFFAAIYLLCRKLFLKDTGRKLAHLEKQLRTNSSISEELSRKLEDE